MKRRGPAPVTDLSEDEADGNTRGILLVGSRKTKRDWKSYAMHKSQQTPCLVRCGAPDDSRRHADRVGGRPEEAKKKPANAEQHEEESEEKADGERAPSEPLYDGDYDDDEETFSWGEEEEKQEDKQE